MDHQVFYTSYDNIFITVATANSFEVTDNSEIVKRMFTIYSLQEWCRQLTVNNDDVLDKLELENFDVAVVDELLFTKCVYLVPHRLQIPWITFSVGADPLAVRVPWLPSFVPNIILQLSEEMTFVERLKNTAAFFFVSFAMPLYFSDPQHEVLDKFRRYGYFSSLDELASKSALWFLPNDNVLDYPRPTMPNTINIGGLTVRRTTGKLPPDIKNFIDGAKKGVILMTFGTVTPSIPAHMVEKFASAFGRLDGYRVLWRLKNKDDVKLPDNVLIRPWLPQNDILAQPSVKLFITHCGNNGQYESVYHAVPMIGFPVLGDQHHNAKRLDHKGYGLSMDLHEFTVDDLLENIHKILGDKLYKERVTKASEIFRSQAQSPVERATFWIEHVCRFGGNHLRSAGNDLPLYSYLMLDVLAFILIILHISIYLLFRLLRLVVNKCCGRSASSNASKKND